MQITTGMIDEGLKALNLDTEMLGKIGTGEVELMAAMVASKEVSSRMMVAMIMTNLEAPKLAEKLQKHSAPEGLGVVMEGSSMLNLSALFFRLGYLLATKAISPSLTPQEVS